MRGWVEVSSLICKANEKKGEAEKHGYKKNGPCFWDQIIGGGTRGRVSEMPGISGLEKKVGKNGFRRGRVTDAWSKELTRATGAEEKRKKKAGKSGHQEGNQSLSSKSGTGGK